MQGLSKTRTEVPEVLVLEILSKLPVKSLTRFREETEKSFDLWVMNGSWTKLFTIESVPGVERPLGFWKNGELFLESSDHELVLFDPSTGELKNLGIHAYRETMQIISYVESLIPINGRSEHEERLIRQPAGGA